MNKLHTKMEHLNITQYKNKCHYEGKTREIQRGKVKQVREARDDDEYGILINVIFPACSG